MEPEEPIDNQTGEVVPPPVSSPPTAAEYPRSYAPPHTEDPMMKYLIPVRTSGWAVAAGYLGLFAVLCVFAPFALLAGVLALQDIKKNPEKTGKGRAWFGVGMGIAGTVGLLAILLPALMNRR